MENQIDPTILKNYQLLLTHYGNKYTDFDLFFQNYEGLFVFSRIDIVFNILTKLIDDKVISKDQSFLETGSGDGRIVALAALLGFKSYGIELSDDMKNKSLDHLKSLKKKNILKRQPIVIQGDFLKEETYERLGCSFNQIDIFFNYYTSTEILVSKVHAEAKSGACLISVSLSKKPVMKNLDVIISSTLPDHNHYLFVYKKT